MSIIKAVAGPAGEEDAYAGAAGQLCQTEATMQDFNPAGGAAHSRLANPLLDFATAMAEAQLKYWQAYQVEGAAFVAKRMRADLEFLRALGHCGDPQAIAECQWSWFGDFRKDYAEEMARLVATTFTLGISEIIPLGGRVFTQARPKAYNGLGQTTDASGTSAAP